jgi:rubredoxin
VNDPQPTPDVQRDELRQRWLGHAAAAFDLMFRPEYQDQLVTFDQREQRAGELGQDLTAWLLQQHVNAEVQARSDTPSTPCCPKCGRTGHCLTESDEPLPQRQLTTRTGEVTIRRERWRCTTCRVVFFPLRPAARIGDRGL